MFTENEIIIILVSVLILINLFTHKLDNGAEVAKVSSIVFFIASVGYADWNVFIGFVVAYFFYWFVQYPLSFILGGLLIGTLD